MAAVSPPLDIKADPLIAEAKQRARRRRLLALAAAGLIAAGLLAFELAPSGSGGGVHGTIPWLPTKPSVGPANPPLAAPCTASRLHGSLEATGSSNNSGATQEFGTIELVNRSSTACALVGSPSFSAEGWRTTRYRWGRDGDLFIPSDPLAPPVGSLRALRPGAHVLAILRVPGCTQDFGDTKPLRALSLAAPAGGQITFDPRSSTFVSCNAPAGTTVRATPYVPYVPMSEKRSSELPLRARIVHTGSDRRIYYGTIGKDGKEKGDPNVAAGAGRQLSYTVVLKNRSSNVFRFGATCPSYTESVDEKYVAYVLNCHPVGSIDPGQSVRFAMRIRLPKHPPGHWQAQLSWTLSPHSYNPPNADAGVVRR